MDHKQEARKLFLEGYNCSQAVIAAFSDVTGMDKKEALMLSSSFGGGMGQLGEVCGAVTGMFMAAGLLYGYHNPNNPELKQNQYALIRKMAEKFKEKYPSLLCRDLLGYLKEKTYTLPDGADVSVYEKRPCLIFVEYAAEIMDEIIKENQ